jgi:putative endonuclease
MKLRCLVAFYVYLIQSKVDQSYYKGFTENPVLRLARHNNGGPGYTRNKIPWLIVYLEIKMSKRDALVREKVLKKYSHSQIEQLIASAKNDLNRFIEDNFV